MILQIPHVDGTVAAIFRLPAKIWADHINLVGDFNDWNTSATPMRRGERYWEATVNLPAGSTSYYAYLVDDTDWCSEYQGVQARELNAAGPPIQLIPIEVLNARARVSSSIAS